ncbi:MAG: malate dehydrogenase [Chloroflexota bacterium]
MQKISIIGAGNVGASTAQRIIEKGYADVVLVDIIEGLPQGKALDIQESAPVIGFDSHIVGTNDYEETANSDIVVITSGIGRKPGMTRDELVQTNRKIVSDVMANVAKRSPDCILIVVTNPVDAMAYLALKTSGLPRNRVFGLSGVLDGARLRTFIAAELKVSVTNVHSCILGEHGENMVVVPRLCTVNGVALTELLPQEAIDRLIQRTIKGGAEIVNLLKTGSAFYAPSASITRMVEAVAFDKKQILPCAAYLDGEYGMRDIVMGVPVKLGRAGIEGIIELELSAEEKTKLASSAEAIRKTIRLMG